MMRFICSLFPQSCQRAWKFIKTQESITRGTSVILSLQDTRTYVYVRFIDLHEFERLFKPKIQVLYFDSQRIDNIYNQIS